MTFEILLCLGSCSSSPEDLHLECLINQWGKKKGFPVFICLSENSTFLSADQPYTDYNPQQDLVVCHIDPQTPHIF